MTSRRVYQKNGLELEYVGTFTGTVKNILRWLWDHHSAQEYQIDGTVYGIDYQAGGYRRV